MMMFRHKEEEVDRTMPNALQNIIDQQKQFARETHVRYGKSEYFYIYGLSEDEHRKVTLGPFDTEQEAQSEGLALKDAEVFHLPTKSRRTAEGMIKGEMIGRMVDHLGGEGK